MHCAIPLQYLSYDNPTDADPLPSAPTTTAGRRRLAHVLGGASRDLLQLEKSGAELKVIVATNLARVDSEIRAFEDGVESGAMAQDFTLAGVCGAVMSMACCICCSVKARSSLWRYSGTLLRNGCNAGALSRPAAPIPAEPICLFALKRLAGIDTENLTMLATPYTEDLIGPGNTQEGGNSSFKVRLGWEGEWLCWAGGTGWRGDAAAAEVLLHLASGQQLRLQGVARRGLSGGAASAVRHVQG